MGDRIGRRVAGLAIGLVMAAALNAAGAWRTQVCTCSRIPSSPYSLPHPERFTPPNGARSARPVRLWVLMKVNPASTRAPTANAW